MNALNLNRVCQFYYIIKNVLFIIIVLIYIAYSYKFIKISIYMLNLFLYWEKF